MFLSFCIKDANNGKEHLQQDLSQVAKSYSELHLLINPKKTKYLLIDTRQLLQNLPSDMSLNFLGEIITPAPAATVSDPQGHDIKLNTFKTSVDLKFITTLQNLTTTNQRERGESKYGRKMTKLDVVTTRILYRVNGVLYRINNGYPFNI